MIASMYAVYHGPEGLTRDRAARASADRDPASAGLERLGFDVPTRAFFDTLVVATGDAHRATSSRAASRADMNFRRVDDATLGISLDETTTRDDVEAIWRSVRRRRTRRSRVDDLDAATGDALPRALARTSPFLTHPVFNRYHSETEMLRYLRRLADRDLALDRAMIPLGSCTMKLNATSEMIPVTWPEFGALHPFAPADQAEGYRTMIARARADAVRGHRLRRRVAAAQRRLAGRVRGAAR